MKLWPTSNKGALDALVGIAIGILVVIIAVGTALVVADQYQQSLPVDGAAYNATGDLILEVAKLPSWVGIVVTVSIAASILGLVALFRMGR